MSPAAGAENPGTSLTDHFFHSSFFIDLVHLISLVLLFWVLYRLWKGHTERLKADKLIRRLVETDQTAEALVNSQKMLDAIFNGSMDALCVIDGATRQIIDCNQRTLDLFECDDRDQILGRTGHSLATMTVPEEVATEAYRRIDEGETWTREFKFLTFRGNAFWGSLAIVRLNLADSHLLLARVSDITESLRKEEDRMRLSAAIEQATEAIVITDAKGNIEYVNPAFEAVSGYSRDEALSQNPRILKSDRHGPEFYAEMWKTISAGNVWKGHLCNRRKDGTVYEEEGSITPVRNAGGEIVNYVAVKRDVTRDIMVEAHLRQQQKLESIGTLAAGVAHEINNPLTGILNYAEFIRDDPRAGGEAHESAGEIVRQSERVADIVSNLLAFSRQETTETPLQPACMSDIVARTLPLVRTIMRHDNIVLSVEEPSDLPPVLCRPQQIQQILLNLLTNARDALKDAPIDKSNGRRISLIFNVTLNGTRYLRTTVEDNGSGVSPQIRERVFDPFFTTKPRNEGTGLGLSISHGIAREHNGSLTLESAPGSLTRFHLDLPLAPEASSVEAVEKTNTAGEG